MDSRKLEDLFHRALELPDTERDAFLDQECFFREKKGRWYLCDAGSRNGTYVEGKKLKPKRQREIISGQLLGFGDVQCRFYTAADLYELLTDTGADTDG